MRERTTISQQRRRPQTPSVRQHRVEIPPQKMWVMIHASTWRIYLSLWSPVCGEGESWWTKRQNVIILSWFCFNKPTRFGTTWDQPKWRSQCCRSLQLRISQLSCQMLRVVSETSEGGTFFKNIQKFRRKGQRLRKHHDSGNNFPSSAAVSVHMFKSSRSKGCWTQHINTRWKLDRSPKPLKHLTQWNQDLVQHLCGEVSRKDSVKLKHKKQRDDRGRGGVDPAARSWKSLCTLV